MSLNAYIWAADLPLSVCNGTAHRVLLKLADRADDLGYGAYPSVKNIAASLVCSERTVFRALKELQLAGLIRRGDQRYVEHIDPRHRPTVYDVLTWALKYSEEHDESRGDIRVTPGESRGDTNRRSGVTTGVTRTVLKPTYQDTSRHLSLVTARESGRP